MSEPQPAEDEPEPPRRRRIAVLLATYNGAKFLAEQLQSVADQKVDAHIDIFASDDGSSDDTDRILADWQRRWRAGTFEIRQGPRQGYTENFRSLLVHTAGNADCVAFCDQDDVWMPEKLAQAMTVLGGLAGPGLYCSRTLRVDETLRPIGHSPLFSRPPSFRNALVQSIAGGNTMVMNKAGAELVAESARRTSFVSHDWWCYLLLSGAGGTVVYDPVPRVAYRQHADNIIGDNVGWRARLLRVQLSLAGRFAGWNAVNLAALERCRDLLTAEALEVLTAFAAARRAGPVAGLQHLKRSGVYRQLSFDNLSLKLATLLRKI